MPCLRQDYEGMHQYDDRSKQCRKFEVESHIKDCGADLNCIPGKGAGSLNHRHIVDSRRCPQYQRVFNASRRWGYYKSTWITVRWLKTYLRERRAMTGPSNVGNSKWRAIWRTVELTRIAYPVKGGERELSTYCRQQMVWNHCEVTQDSLSQTTCLVVITAV